MCRPYLKANRPPHKSTPPPPPAALPEEKRAALETHGLLAQNLTDLRKEPQSGVVQVDKIEAILSNASQYSDDLAKYLSATIEPCFSNEIPPNRQPLNVPWPSPSSSK